MEYTVKRLARLAGITVRALHYYDEVGLLRPARIGRNGCRYYGERELLRLQQVLFFRELGMPLNTIRDTLDSEQFDQLAAPRNHRDTLAADLEHTRALIATIDRTIDHLEGGANMSDEELFKGFDPAR